MLKWFEFEKRMLLGYIRKVSGTAITEPLDTLVHWMTPEYQCKDYEYGRESSHNTSLVKAASFGAVLPTLSHYSLKPFACFHSSTYTFYQIKQNLDNSEFNFILLKNFSIFPV